MSPEPFYPNPIKPTLKDNCQNQVIDYTPSSEVDSVPKLFYCLIFKEYLDNCPSQCPYFIAGAAIPMEFLYEHNFEIECPHLYLLVKKSSIDEKRFICEKIIEEQDPQKCKKLD